MPKPGLLKRLSTQILAVEDNRRPRWPTPEKRKKEPEIAHRKLWRQEKMGGGRLARHNSIMLQTQLNPMVAGDQLY